MNRQVDLVTARTVVTAGELFEDQNELQRQLAEILARSFTEGRRALALLDEALRSGDIDYIVGQVDYEIALSPIDPAENDPILVFTNDQGDHVVTLLAGERIEDRDVAGLEPLARRLLFEEDEALELSSYRMIGDRFYRVQTFYIGLDFPIGTITVGFPLRTLGSSAFDVCIFAGSRCAVRSSGIGDDVEALVASGQVTEEPLRVTLDDEEWSIQAAPLIADQPEVGARVTAVPLDPVLAPFEGIQRALLLGGGFALLLSGLIGAAMSRSLTRPIRDLVDAAGRVSKGEYDREVVVTSRDEVGTLANAFNDMTRGLRLREQYRSVLNKVVSQEVAEELMKGEVELGGENRQISVLFADIRGFTPLTEGMEPQELIAFLNDCMDRLSRAVDAEGGWVDKFIGDEVMAVFGAPVVRDDHADRALATALRMRASVEEMNRDREARGEAALGVGIGIGTGVAVAGNMGSSDRLSYTVLGETVNLAARLTGQARAGEILVTNRTLAAASGAYETTPAGERTLKGFSADIEVFLVGGSAVPA